MALTLTARNASLADMAEILRDQHARRIDVVAPASSLRFDNGVLHIQGSEPVLTEAGVTMTEGAYVPTEVFDAGMAEKLNIPVSYVRRLRSERVDLFDANTNGWLHGMSAGRLTGDPRSFLIRGFRGEDGPGVARAMLSHSYRIIDNFDALLAALDGVRQAGVTVEVDGADLTETRMQVRLIAPQVQALAPVLLDGYRSPFRTDRIRRAGGDGNPALTPYGFGDASLTQPIVSAGLVIRNSETGGGAFTITPRIVVLVCKNGMTRSVDAVREVHLGGRQADGLIQWSDDTQAKSLALITAKTRDAVSSFLDGTYLQRAVAEIEAHAGADLSGPKMPERVKEVTRGLKYDEQTASGILDHFTRAGQLTSGGLANAYTSYAQAVADPELAARLENDATKAMVAVIR